MGMLQLRTTFVERASNRARRERKQSCKRSSRCGGDGPHNARQPNCRAPLYAKGPDKTLLSN
eukprot:4075367-Pleurochrysis_carterae.AAC.1